MHPGQRRASVGVAVAVAVLVVVGALLASGPGTPATTPADTRDPAPADPPATGPTAAVPAEPSGHPAAAARLTAAAATGATVSAQGHPDDAPACGEAAVSPFEDVDRGSVHAAGIDCVRWYGVVGGQVVDLFAPDERIRRDQLASFVAGVVTAADRTLPAGEGRFVDLDGNLHRDAIESLAAAGVVDGRTTDRYEPAGPVSRAQMTAFLVRAYEYVTATQAPAGDDAFTDDDGHVHEPTIDAAAALGLVHGRTATTFAPDEATTRAHLASFLALLLDRLAADGALQPRPAGYTATTSTLPSALRERMTGGVWEPACPVHLDDLRLVELTHHDLDGRLRTGLLVVHRTVADDLTRAFADLHAAGFGVASMRLIEHFGGSDDRSMAANNTSAFNCRRVAGSSSWSQHAYGTAIDINPVQNPWVTNDGSEVEPEAGRDYLDRDDVRAGMIVRPGPVVETLVDREGWGWGGDWRSVKDYQHLSVNGR